MLTSFLSSKINWGYFIPLIPPSECWLVTMKALVGTLCTHAPDSCVGLRGAGEEKGPEGSGP